MPGYLLAQVVGAVLASLVLQWMYGNVINGATEPTPDVTVWVAILTEAVLTLGLVSVILGTASGARNVGANGALAVGGYIGLLSVWAAPVTGASMNPARSFGPDLVGADFSHYWIYLAGPLLGRSTPHQRPRRRHRRPGPARRQRGRHPRRRRDHQGRRPAPATP